MTSTTPQDSRVAKALSAESSSIRLQAALAIGSGAEADYTELLVERCAIEPDFFVRDMLSWALTRLPPEIVLVPPPGARLRVQPGPQSGPAHALQDR